MIDDTNTTIMMYPSNKTISIADKNVSGVNIGTNGSVFTTNTIKIGNANSAVNLNSDRWVFTQSGNLNKSGNLTDFNGINLPVGGCGIHWGNGYSRIVDDANLQICTDDNMYFRSGSNSTSLGTTRMCIIGSNVGIGTEGPSYNLEVNGNARIGSTFYPDGGIYARAAFQFTGPYAANGETPRLNFDVTNLGSAIISCIGGGVGAENAQTRLRFYAGGREALNINTASGRLGIYNRGDPSYDMDINGSLRYASAVQNSDRRIKKNIVDVNDSSALDTLRLLKPKIYEYIDQEKRTEKVVYGFIAQEVKEVLDYAVYQNSDYIPNIYEKARATSDTLRFTIFDTSNLSRDKNGSIFRLVVKTKDEMMEYANIVEIMDEHTLRIDRDLRDLCENGFLFVYGQEVDDFHTLSKDAIWTVTTAALQEVDRQVQRLDEQLQQEKEKTATLQAQVQTLQQNYESLLARILSLESK